MNDFHMGYMQGFKDACLQEQSDSVEQGNVSEKLGEPNWKVIAEERAIEISKMTSNKYPFVHIRMDVGEAEKEGALKDKLIELGWTPPNSEKQEQRSDNEHTGEPVAWMRQDGQRVTTASDRHNYPDYETRYSIPLYTTPYVPTGRQQRDSSATPRTWVGLTDEDISICLDAGDGSMSKIISFIEAKLKEKNTRNGGCL
jgi:hypothetical protein